MNVELIYKNSLYNKTPTKKRKSLSERSDLPQVWFLLTVKKMKLEKKEPWLNKEGKKEGRFSNKTIQPSLHHAQSVLHIYAATEFLIKETLVQFF